MTTQAVEFGISLQDVDLQRFDVLEVWRSRSTASGPYEPLTSMGSAPARLPIDAPNPPDSPQDGPFINATGKQLLLKAGQDVLTITATGIDPLTYGQLATQITNQTLGEVSAYVIGALLVIQTREFGGHASLIVTGGDIAGLTGIPLNLYAYGRESYVPLVPNVTQYSFTDQQGSTSFFYKIRLRNTLQDLVSEFSDPLSPVATPTVNDTAVGFMDLTDMDGSALEAREVRFYSRFNGQLSDGRVVAGFSKILLTDATGHIELPLVRGLPITVAIAGTDLVRDLVVPTDTTITRFNLLDPTLGKNDVFKVQIPNIPYANRRSF